MKILCLGAFLFLISVPLQAQNTKGDRPQGGATRLGDRKENRFKLFGKKKQKQPSYGPRVKAKPRPPGRAASARRSSKAEKTKVYPQPPTARTQPSKREKAWRGTASGAPLRVRSSTGQSRNIYPQSGRYVNNPSRKPRKVEQAASNRNTLSRLKKIQGDPVDREPKPKRKKIVPRSASKPFMARRSINVYANFPRPKRKTEQSTNRDLAGRKIRTRNYETPKPKAGIAPSRPTRYRPERTDDRPYKGPSGTYRTRTRTTQKAWKGDIAGRRIRHRNYSSKPKVEAGRPVFPPRNLKDDYRDRPYRGPSGGYRSATKPGEKRTGIRPNPARAPGMGALGVGGYRGNIKSRRPLKGGGSVSGRHWNNNGNPNPARTPGMGAVGIAGYKGTLKARRPLKGGGSVSGRSWNNKGNPLAVRPPGTGKMAAGFPGKMRRFAKPGFADQGEGFTGLVRRSKPLKGGGSVSGKSWNNRGTPIPVRTPKSGEAARVGYSGNIKASRPVKGGGSISGRTWNNKEKPIPARTPPAGAEKVGGYPGKMKRYSATPGFNDQGEEFTGYIRRPRLWKDYIKNDKAAEGALKKKRPTSATWRTGELQVMVRQRRYVKNKNAAESALPKQAPTRTTEATDGLQVRVRQRKYVPNKNAADESLRKQAPTEATYATGGLQVRVKQKAYGEKPRAADGAMPGIKPSKSSIKASEFSRSVRSRWDYVRNPSSADEALKVREPGKAFAKATDYQGNIKVQKFKLFEKNRQLHPDATFVKTNKNNVDGERDLVTNFKLWWARLFRKQETQPDHLKEKGKKPRYDKGEEGLWYD